MMSRRHIIPLLTAAAGRAPPARAQSRSAAVWPDRPVRFVVPYPPGGGLDALARALADRAAGRMLVMTGKDAVKLRVLLGEGADAWVLEQSVTLEGGADALDTALRRALREPG